MYTAVPCCMPLYQTHKVSIRFWSRRWVIICDIQNCSALQCLQEPASYATEGFTGNGTKQKQERKGGWSSP